MNELICKWENAYADQMHNASVGKLFRGIIHNLNGVIQAFSMQSELFELMFRQADNFFAQISHGTGTEKEEALENLYQLLTKRAVLAEQMNEKVRICQGIVQRTLSLTPQVADPAPDHYLLADLIKEEIDFLCADSFFKHKVAKNLEMEEHLMIPQKDLACIRLALQAVLGNALEAMKETTEESVIGVTTRKSGEGIVLEITDNGPGFSPDIQEKIFSPFFTTKKNNVGLGLYIARKILEQLGGSIAASCHKGRTSFLIQFSPPSQGCGQKQ